MKYSRHKVICTCEMGLTFTAAIDFVAIEIGKVLETLELIFLTDKVISDKGFCWKGRKGMALPFLPPRK